MFAAASRSYRASSSSAVTKKLLARAYSQGGRWFATSDPDAPATPTSTSLTTEQHAALDAWVTSTRTATHTIHEHLTVPRVQALYSTIPTRASPSPSLAATQPKSAVKQISNNPGAIRDSPVKDGLALRPAHSLAFFSHVDFAESDLCGDGTEPLMRPPAPFDRRMWVGGAFEWKVGRGLEVGSKSVAKHSVESVEQKGLEEGKTGGPMVFVNQKIDYYQAGQEDAGEEVFTERRTHVYLPPYKHGSRRAVKEISDLPKPDFTYTWTPTPIALFRFSALMFNAHHIHIDPVIAQHEGYAERLVHGPLTALMLIEALTYAIPSVTFTGFEYRAINPVVVNQRQKICATLASDRQSAFLWAVDDNSVVSMTGKATFGNAVARQ